MVASQAVQASRMGEEVGPVALVVVFSSALTFLCSFRLVGCVTGKPEGSTKTSTSRVHTPFGVSSFLLRRWSPTASK